MTDHAENTRDMRPLDWVMCGFAMPALIFALMFATSGMMDTMDDTGKRRRFVGVLLVVEFAIIGAAVAYVMWARSNA
jgi:hypothetical protein